METVDMLATATQKYGHLENWDFAVIGGYLAVTVILGAWFMRRGTKDTRAYFTGSGAIPWWVTGFSLLVACFAADTPLWLGDIIYKRGLEGAWLYWAPAIGTAFFIMMIGPLWKRSGIMTDLEFLEFRYKGMAAAVMRGLNGVYYSLFFSIMMMAVTTLSIVKIMQATTDWDKWVCVVVTMAFAASYCVISGLWGVATSGFLQFFVTFIGSSILAIFAVRAVGGPGALIEGCKQLTDWPGHNLNMFPSLGTAHGLPVMTLLFLFTLRWVEQTGMGQYVAQRLFATKNTREAAYTAMVWGVGFFAVVPLPWLVTVVASKLVLPGLEDGQEAYPRMAMQILPIGMKGILVASMLAAFMSTYSSLMSWGSSYAVNDLYKRFLHKNAGEKLCVRVGQLFMIPMAVISGYIALRAESILNLLFVVMMATTGYYTVMIARWIWWRVNAWSEVAGLGGSLLFTLLIPVIFPRWVKPELMEEYFGHRMIFVMVGTLVAWVVITLATKPTEEHVLDEFYRKVRPPGFWGPVRRRLGVTSDHTLGGIICSWLIMLIGIYGPLVGFVKMAFGQVLLGGVLAAVGIIMICLAIKRVKAFYQD